MKITRLSSLEVIPSGFTHGWRITVDDLTETAADTAQVLTLRAMEKFETVGRCATFLEVPLEDSDDGDFDDNEVSVGHTDGATAFVAATQFNENGTTVEAAIKDNAHVFVAADKNLTCTVNSMTGKSLSDLDKGSFYVFANIANLKKAANWE